METLTINQAVKIFSKSVLNEIAKHKEIGIYKCPKTGNFFAGVETKTFKGESRMFQLVKIKGSERRNPSRKNNKSVVYTYFVDENGELYGEMGGDLSRSFDDTLCNLAIWLRDWNRNHKHIALSLPKK